MFRLRPFPAEVGVRRGFGYGLQKTADPGYEVAAPVRRVGTTGRYAKATAATVQASPEG